MIDEASSGPHDNKCKSSFLPRAVTKGRRIRIQKAPADVASEPKLLLKFLCFPTPTSGFLHNPTVYLAGVEIEGILLWNEQNQIACRLSRF